MDGIIDNLKRMFRTGNIVTKLLYINVGLFILIRLAVVLFTLFNQDGSFLLRLLQMPSAPDELLRHPWTVLTYMFTHYEMLHLLFNMLWLYWFGQLFLQFFNGRQLARLYVLGGLAGAVFFATAYNVFPYFHAVAGNSFLMGASASVMAVVFAVSFYRKDYEINLLLIGRVKLIYLALFSFILDFLTITSGNAGGHLAHIGGALVGIWFAYAFTRKPKMRVVMGKRATDYAYNARKRNEEQQLNDILDKLKRSGYGSLSAEEKKLLFDAGKN